MVNMTPQTIINAVSVPAGSSVTSSGIDLNQAVDFSIGAIVVFPTGADNNLRLELFADPTGASQDFTIGSGDESIEFVDVAYVSNTTIRGSYKLDKSAKYVKIKATNLGSIDISSATLYATVQTA